MPRRSVSPSGDMPNRLRPATTPADRETQLISLADSLAERQLRDGTASSQVITHYLKLGSSRERLEQERIALETELVKAKTEAIASQQRQEEMYREALLAMRSYSGQSNPVPDTEEYYE